MTCLPLRTKSAILVVMGCVLAAVANNNKQGGPVSLSAKISQDKNRVMIDYTFENNGDRTIYVWDVMTNVAGEEQAIDPAVAYVFWEEPSTIRVVRGILDEPPDIHPVVRELPFVRKVQSHESARGVISLALPLHEYSPFYPPEARSKPVQCDRIRLIIGWIEHQEGMVFSERKVGDQQALALRGSWPRPPQHLAEKFISFSGVLLVREDNFDRRFPTH